MRQHCAIALGNQDLSNFPQVLDSLVSRFKHEKDSKVKEKIKIALFRQNCGMGISFDIESLVYSVLYDPERFILHFFKNKN